MAPGRTGISTLLGACSVRPLPPVSVQPHADTCMAGGHSVHDQILGESKLNLTFTEGVELS